MAENVNEGQIVNSTNRDSSCLEIADKNRTRDNLVASFGAGLRSARAAIFDDAGFWAVLHLKLAVRLCFCRGKT
jgi:hypothetical protein